MRIKKNDQVMVICGKERGKKGRVMKIYPQENAVLIEKMNYQTIYLRRSQKNPQGGISKAEGKVQISNVQLVCPRCSKPARIKFSILADGAKQRVCQHCHEII